MKKQYSNPNTEISWWVGDNLCDGTLYNPDDPGGKPNPAGHVTSPSSH